MKIAGWLIAASLVFTACTGNTTAPSNTGGGAVATEAPSFDVTAEMVVSAMDPAAVVRFCTAYEQLGDYETALAAFSRTYTESDPSAREVMDEILSRC